MLRNVRSASIAPIACTLLMAGCGPVPDRVETSEGPTAPRLEVLGAERTGITFRNSVIEDDSANYFRYTYMYNGGGVAVGDIDGDSLPDLAFVSNRSGAALYRNRGDLRFQDITDSSGFHIGHTWATGVAMADVNADGLLDIYVCASGPAEWPVSTRRNLLFLNQGGGRFREAAAEAGLADEGHSTMAYFADLDQDDDLDCFIVGHRADFHQMRTVITDARWQPVPDQTDRLYLNDGTGHFTDRTAEAGLLSRHFGLAAAIGDLNGDGRNDIYVCNDFHSPDRMMLNDGSRSRGEVPHFTDGALTHLGHTAYYSMGVDLADYNNDGHRDLYQLDMTPGDHRLNKENMASMAPDQFRKMVAAGMHHQYMANALQLNNGDGTWSEVGQLAGVDRTDWSWAPLFVDLDNDGWKDLFVTNGIPRDVTNSDFRAEVRRIAETQGTNLPFRPILELAPTHMPEKFVFRNRGDLTFSNATGEWGYVHKALGTGAAYADLDRDGDMDLVTVDVNAAPGIIRNGTRGTKGDGYLQLVIKGTPANPFAIGASATVHADGGTQVCDLFTARGYQSSVEPLLHFGLGGAAIDSVVVTWPDGLQRVIRSPERDQRLVVERTDLRQRFAAEPAPPLFTEVSASVGLARVHRENDFDDFATETLLPQRQSDHGPCAAAADVNGDGREDLFLGASAGTTCTLLLQDASGHFAPGASQPWAAFKEQEFLGAHFFDADGDGDADLYLAAGSTEWPAGSERYRDRLFLNDGTGRFAHAPEALPDLRTSTAVVASNDLDGDGDLDLFIGGRNVPGAWPAAPPSHVLINTGGRFADASATWLADTPAPGLITAAVFADVNADERRELVLAGEWMAIRILRPDAGRLKDITATLLDTTLTGWWQGLGVADVDQDGDADIVAGNLGLNNKFHPSKEHPLKVYMSDLDDSGTNDIVLAKSGDKCDLPVRGRECSSGQMPFIKEKFPTYKAFAGASLEEIYGPEKLAKAVRLQVDGFASLLLRNGGGRFTAEQLPMAAQVAPLRSIVVADVNGDGHKDLVVAGNMHGAEVETTRYDAGVGLVLTGDAQGEMHPLPSVKSGISMPYDTRLLVPIGVVGKGRCLLAVNNNGPVQLYAPRDAAPIAAQAAR